MRDLATVEVRVAQFRGFHRMGKARRRPSTMAGLVPPPSLAVGLREKGGSEYSPLIGVKPSPRHSSLGLPTVHERIPYKGGAGIFCHQHADARIDAHHVGAIPAG